VDGPLYNPLFFVKSFFIYVLFYRCCFCFFFFFLPRFMRVMLNKLFLTFSLRRWSGMVCFKGFQRDGGHYLFVVDAEDAPPELGSSFLVQCFA